jgi:hypothetical protein
MAGCVTGKRIYPTQEIAEEVLIQAWITYDYRNGRGPVAVYQCADCGQYHLTSTGEINPKLALYLKEGRIKVQKEANRWMERFKKR